MRTTGDRLILPLVVLAVGSLLVGFPPRAGSDAAEPGAAPAQAKPPQTRKTQTRPAPPQTAPSRKASAPEKPLVFTDEDLKRSGSGEVVSPARPARIRATPPPGDPLKPFRDREEKARWRQERVATFQQKILDLEVRLRLLEQKKLSIVNPFAPRPPEPDGSESSEKGLSGPELLARTEQEIKETNEKLEAARRELTVFLDSNPE